MHKFIHALIIRVIFLMFPAVIYLTGTHTPGVGVLVYPVTLFFFVATQIMAGFLAE